MRIEVRLFAGARQRAGSPHLVVELAEPATVADLRQALAAAAPELAPVLPGMMVGIDAEYARDGDVIVPGSEVALIPPVSGGSGQGGDAR